MHDLPFAPIIFLNCSFSMPDKEHYQYEINGSCEVLICQIERGWSLFLIAVRRVKSFGKNIRRCSVPCSKGPRIEYTRQVWRGLQGRDILAERGTNRDRCPDGRPRPGLPRHCHPVHVAAYSVRVQDLRLPGLAASDSTRRDEAGVCAVARVQLCSPQGGREAVCQGGLHGQVVLLRFVSRF